MDDLLKVFYAYHSLKMFLARIVGFVALGYGAATFMVYFIILGFVLIVLFWILDRMGPQSTTAPPQDGDGPLD